jgi:hypothetical protein
LIAIKAQRVSISSTSAMRKLTYQCPNAGVPVQIELAREADRHKSGRHEAVVCQACTRLHFIEVTTGKLLGHDQK